MKTIAVVCEKGGTGKSMIANELYESYVRQGVPASLYSLDGQYKDASSSKKVEDAEVAIVDTPGVLTDNLSDLVSGADVIVIPVRPTPNDIEPFTRTVSIVTKNTNAPLVIVPPDFDNIELLSRVKELLSPAGFGSFSVTTADSHDEMIAFTSQMAHLVSNAYIKSPTAKAHKGFSAGSYKDMTRVAWLNAPMWSELFLENRDHMLRELDGLMDCLMQYRAAIAENDGEALTQLLEEGKKRKEEVDGR